MPDLAFTAPTSIAAKSFVSSQACSFTKSNASPIKRLSATRTKYVPCTRRVFKMQEEAADEIDDAPSDTYVPASEGTSGGNETQQAAKRSSLISKLLQLCAITARGQLSTESQRNIIEDLVTQLEEVNPTSQPVDTDFIDGYWTLAYTSASSSSSPIKSLSKILLQPVLQFGQVRQRIAVSDGSLSTEVDIIAFPATSGTIKSVGRITPVGGERIEIVLEKSTITGGKLGGQLDLGGLSFDIPVEQILSRVRNMSPETYFDTYYLDDQLRISRGKDSKLYIYTRLE